MTETQKKFYTLVDEILWDDWDPIGVNDIAPRDEYQSYVPKVFSLLIISKTDREIADRLYKIETETIWVLGNHKHCLEIAKKSIEKKNKLTTLQQGV